MLPIHRSSRIAAVAVLTAALFPFASAQTRAKTDQRKYVQGTIASVWGNHVYVNDELGVVALAVEARTEIWKGKVFHDLSPVESGDRVFATCHRDTYGNLVAESIDLNRFHSVAAITGVSDTGFSVFTNPGTDPQSGYMKESRIVEVDADTIFEDSAREDLKVGRGVDLDGLDLRNGTVRATKVTVYEGKHAVRFKGGRIIMPNGEIRTVLPNGKVVGPVLGQLH